jgi:uncharacterized protein YukE
MPVIDDLKQRLTQETDRIVRGGEDIRARISQLTAGAAMQFHQAAAGFNDLAQAVATGAVQGVEAALPEGRESRLREVVAGLMDGLRTAAEAVDLTLQESTAAGRKFAEEDLRKAHTDLRTVAGLFTESAGGFLEKLGGTATGQTAALRDHAVRAYQQSRPSVEKALTSLWNHLGEVGRETGQAGLSAARSASGTLFTELGERLANLGRKLRE